MVALPHGCGAECVCPVGSLASLSTVRPVGPDKSVKSVARFVTGEART
jgi:hypothetical protein